MLHASRLGSFIIVFVFGLTLRAPFVFASDQVHFGSIFVEDNNFKAEEAKESLNKLTDGSEQQRNLETLNPELKKDNERLREMSRQPAATPAPAPPPVTVPAPTPVATTAPVAPPAPNTETKVGVIRNSEMQRHVVYFIELRPIQGNAARPLYPNANTLTKSGVKLEPGELVKVVDTSDEYLSKLRMDRDNQGMWKQVARRRDADPTDLFAYYDWKNFDTVLQTQSALEIDILVPRDMSSIPVFARPGAWTAKDCQLGSEICIDRIDHHVDAFLLDTTFTPINDLRTRQDTLQLYYKIGYRIIDKEGKTHHKIGWVPSYFARRKISMLPKTLLSSNEFGATGFETDEERITRLEKYYVFHDNMFSENRLSSRWLTRRPGEAYEVFDNTFDYDMVLGFSSFTLEQSFLDVPFKQNSAMVGLGIYAPLYVDLEVQGTLAFMVPVSYGPEGEYKSTPLFRGDQWLMYTTPVGIDRLPLKFGIGMYYLTMFQSELDFGFKSFVGFQAKLGVENEYFWVDFRFGPTGQDFNFNMNNREIGASLGVRLDPSRSYDSLTIFLDYGTTSYTSPTSNHTTDFEIMNIGLRKTF